MKKNPHMKNERMCIVCRARRIKSDFFRIVKKEDKIFADRIGNSNGRGAYVCKSKECVDKLISKRMLNRAFKTNVSEEVYNSIEV